MLHSWGMLGAAWVLPHTHTPAEPSPHRGGEVALALTQERDGYGFHSGVVGGPCCWLDEVDVLAAPCITVSNLTHS